MDVLHYGHDYEYPNTVFVKMMQDIRDIYMVAPGLPLIIFNKNSLKIILKF